MAALPTVVSNGSVIVSLADVVFRSAIQLCKVIKQVSSAPDSAAGLLVAVKGLAAVVAEVRAWAVDYEKSDFALADGQFVSGNVETSLAACEKQIAELTRRLSGVGNARSGWVQRITGGVVFALSEAQIQHSVQMVIYHQTTLKGLMLVRGA
jgi:hypothetical protein